MRAMVLDRPGKPLALRERPRPHLGPGEILVEVKACGVCRTDLHVVDGELPNPKLPIVPGHEIVGRIVALGPGVSGQALGERVGVPWLGYTCGPWLGYTCGPWLGYTCGVCPYCRDQRENLCDAPLFTGYTGTAALRATRLPMRGTASPCRKALTTRRSRPGFAPG